MNDTAAMHSSRSLRSQDLDPTSVQTMLDHSRLHLSALLADKQQANVAARFHPLFPVLLTGLYGAESHVDLWDLETRQNCHSLSLIGTGHATELTGQTLLGAAARSQEGILPVRDVDVSPTGTIAAVAAGVSVWLLDLGRTAQLMREGEELFGHEVGVHAVAFAHAGDLLASADDAGTVVLWDMATLTSVFHVELDGAHLRDIAFSADDALLAVSDTIGNVAVWDLATAERIAYFQAHQGEIGAIRFSPQGYILATGGFDGAIRLWDIESAAPVGEPMFHDDSIYSLRFGATEDVLYSCSFDKFLAVWDLNTQVLVDCYVSAEPILAMDVAPDDGALAIVTAGGIELVANGHQTAVLSGGLALGVPLDAFAQQDPDSSFGNVRAGLSFEAVAQRADAEPAQPLEARSGLVTDGMDSDYVEARRIGAQSGLINLASARMVGPDSTSAKRYGPGAPTGRDSGQQVARGATPASDSDRHAAGFQDSIPPREGPIVAPLGGELPLRHMITGTDHDNARRPHIPLPSPDASIRHPFTVVVTEDPEKGEATRYGLAIVIAVVVGLAAAGGGYATRPLAEDSPAFAALRQTIDKEYTDGLTAEGQRHDPAINLLESKLDKARLGASGPNAANIIKGLERSVEQENQFHLDKLKEIEAGKEAKLAEAKASVDDSPWSRVTMFGMVGFVGALVLAFLGLRYASKR